MSISRFNHEGYYDPTAYSALTAIERQARKAGLTSLSQNIHGFRPLVFICSPFAGEIMKNAHKTRQFCQFAIKRNCIPVAPHLLFPQFLDDGIPEERKLGLYMGSVLLTKCAELWVFGEQVTDGMAFEIEKAERRQIPIRYFTEEMKEVNQQ